METVYYTLTARGIEVEGELEQAVGAARRVMLVRQPRHAPKKAQDNVVDFTAWKAAREAERAAEEFEDADGPDLPAWDESVRESAPRPARRERRRHDVLFTGELLATLSVIAVAAALVVRILTF